MTQTQVGYMQAQAANAQAQASLQQAKAAHRQADSAMMNAYSNRMNATTNVEALALEKKKQNRSFWSSLGEGLLEGGLLAVKLFGG